MIANNILHDARGLLTIAEVALIFKVHRKTIYNWRRTKILLSVLVGGTVYFDPVYIDEVQKNGSPGRKPRKKKLPEKTTVKTGKSKPKK